jgi:hypothetical protein
MAVIFTNAAGTAENRGRVQVLDPLGSKTAPGSILHAPKDWGGFNKFKAIFTDVAIGESGNYQFQHMLGDHIYVYVFGDRIGTLGLSGLAFFDNCSGEKPNGRIGISHVIEYYRKLKLSAEAEVLQVTIDPDTVFRCFLLAMRGQVVQAANRIFQFQLQFALIPEDAL